MHNTHQGDVSLELSCVWCLRSANDGMYQTPDLLAPESRGQIENNECKQRPASLLYLSLVERVHTICVPKECDKEDRLIVLVTKGCGFTIKNCSGRDFVPPFLPLRAGIDIINKSGIIREILLDTARATKNAGKPVAMMLEQLAEHGVFEEHCNQFLHVELVVDRICPLSSGTAVGRSTVDWPPCTRRETWLPACPTIQVGLMLLHIDAAVVNTSVVLLSGGDLMRAGDGMEKVMGGL